MAYPLTLQEQMEARAEGKLLGLKCGDCGAVTFPAKAVCDQCGGRHLARHEVKGEGVLRTFTVIRVAPTGFETPLVVAMAELAEGPWAVGRLEGVAPDRADMSLMGKKVRLGLASAKPERYGVDQCQVLVFTLAD